MPKNENPIEASLEQLRTRKLLRALHKHGNGMSVAAIAAKLEAKPELVADVIDGKVHVDEQLVERASHAFDVHPDFFSRKELGEFTTHDHFVGRSPFSSKSESSSESSQG